MAFPDADRIERKTLVISREEAKELETLSKSRLPSRLITIYEGWKGTDLLGYMHIDVHPVWAKSQALMIVMNPAGKFTQIEVLAFHESTDYMLPTQILKKSPKQNQRRDHHGGQRRRCGHRGEHYPPLFRGGIETSPGLLRPSARKEGHLPISLGPAPGLRPSGLP